MTLEDIDQLFAQTLMGEYEDEQPWEAVSALRRIGSREVFDRAAAWCKSENPLERARGASVLAQLGKSVEHRTNNFPEESYLAVSQMLQVETEAIPLSSAIAALGHLDDPRAVPLIAGHFQNPAQDVRFSVACALGSFPNHPLAVQMLLILTQDPDEDVRNWAVFGLGVQGDVDSAEIRDALFSRLNDPNEEVREEAIVGLAKRKDQRVLPALREALTPHESGDSDVRMRISEAADYLLGIEEESRDWGAAQYLAALQERFSQ